MKTSNFASVLGMGMALVAVTPAWAELKLPPVTDGMTFKPKAELKAQARKPAEAQAPASTKQASSKSVAPAAPARAYESAGSLAPEDSSLYSVYGQ